MSTRHRSSEMPTTMVELIYLISDEPRRALALDIVLLPVLAAVVQIATPPLTLLKFHASAIWWTGGPTLVVGWLVRATVRRTRGGASRHEPARENRERP
jgi:hypothetical protein